MVRGRDACWEHCVLVDATRQKVRCNYCQREFSGGVYRMKFHLAQIKNKDIIPCAEVPEDVRDHIQSILSTPKKQKASKKQKVDPEVNGQENSSSASGAPAHLNNGSSGPNDSFCPPLLFSCPSPSTQPIIDDAQRLKEENADKKVATFFFHNSVPFSAAKSIYCQEMVDAIVECGVGYKAPSYEKMRSSLLDRVKGDFNEHYKKLRDGWKETGCTIFCDCLTDSGTKSIAVFSVSCCKGTIFLKSIDVSSRADDAQYLFELLESVILEIGVENVVQILTHDSASYVYAGRLVMAKYPSLFWSPCASDCINKMLEDISKQEWVNKILEEANTITTFLYSHAWTLHMMRKFTGRMELRRTKISKFVARFLSLRSIVIQEDNLKHMFSHTEWLSSVYSRRPDAHVVKSLLFSDRFWKSANEVVSVSEPLVKILRIVEGDMPAMGYIYEGMERAKIVIKTYYNDIEENYMPIWDIIDRRWNMQLHSPLHAAAAFLNPSVFYSLNFKNHSRMKNGFQEAMLKMATQDKDKSEITKEHPIYLNAHGALGTEFAIMGRTMNCPGDWWAAYGYEIQTVQRYALRILRQPCSFHWCKWNWSTFENLHTKSRNRMEIEKLNDLVFVHCNLALQAIIKSRDGKGKPVIFDEIDVGLEWPTESDISSRPVDDSWLETS